MLFRSHAEADDAAPAETVRRFEVRHFAVTPDNKVVETTRAVRGMSPEENTTLRTAIREGRITLEQLEALNVGGTPVNGRASGRGWRDGQGRRRAGAVQPRRIFAMGLPLASSSISLSR